MWSMNYLGELEQKPPVIRQDWLQKLASNGLGHPDPDFWVVGVPSSGTRLLTRLLGESGREVNHDQSHGRRVLDPNLVVVIERDHDAVVASALKRDDMPAFTRLTTKAEAEEFVAAARERIADKYPNAPVVSYEALVADQDQELARLAGILGIPVWEAAEIVTNENGKHHGE